MKKIVLILVAVIGFGFTANAGERYKVVVETTLQLVYQDAETYNIVKNENKSGTTQTIFVCAENERDAISQAESECYMMCKRSSNKYEGTTTVNGRVCKVYSTRVIKNSVATVANQSC